MLFDTKIFFLTLCETIANHWQWLLVVLALWIWLHVLRVHRANVRLIQSSNNALGKLFITKGALTTLIQNAISTFNDVYIKRMKLCDKKHILNVQLYLMAQMGANFDQEALQIQERVKESLVQYLGGKKTINVDVILLNIQKLVKRDKEIIIKESDAD